MNTESLEQWITKSYTDPYFFRASRLRQRIQMLDDLDARMDASISRGASTGESAVFQGARKLQARIEASNLNVYRAVRARIRRSRDPRRLGQWRRWIGKYGYRAADHHPGLNYDDLDALVSGILALREPVNPGLSAPEMVFYQPTPARHILDLIEISALDEKDVLVDLGAGLGHVPILTSLLTGCRAIGIERDGAYVDSARQSAEGLALPRVQFIQQDARDADYSAGTVFYLYTPFTGTVLSDVVGTLRAQASLRKFRVCTLGPCVSAFTRQTWLTAAGIPQADRITCFHS